MIYTYIPTGYPGNDIPDGDVMTAVIHLHGNCFDLPNSVPFPYTEALNIHCSLGCLWFLRARVGKRGPAILAVNRKRGCFLQLVCAYADSAARAVAFL